MTIEQFNDEVCNFTDLYYFCLRHDYYDLVEDYRDGESIDEYIDMYYMDDISGYSWRDLCHTLTDLEYEVENYNMFYVGNGCVEGVSDYGPEYDEMKAELIRVLTEDGELVIDEDDEVDHKDEDQFIYVEEPAEEPDGIAVEEDFSIIDVIDEGYKVQILGSNKKDKPIPEDVIEDLSILF